MADMTHTRLELCNMIRMEAEHTKDNRLPFGSVSADGSIRHP